MPTPSQTDPSHFPRFAVTVDLVALTVARGALEVLLIDRLEPPFEGAAALPGGFIRADEDADGAARREFAEEVGLEEADIAGARFEQVRVFSAPGRDPRERAGEPAETYRIVSVAYLALSPLRPEPVAGGDARNARWVPVAEARAGGLAFDHDDILATCLEAAARRLKYTTAGAALAGASGFTLGELQAVYEAVWGETFNTPNFRRKVLAIDGFLRPTGERRVGAGGGAPALVYEVERAGTLSAPILPEVARGG